MSDELVVEGLYSGYRGVEVLHGIDLKVRRGEVVAMFGPNGAGKTTTLLTLAGILPVKTGMVSWSGDARQLPAHRRAREGVALVAERSVFLSLSVEANLRLGGGDPAQALELFPELGWRLKQRAGLLSGGEQQMLTLGRALAGQPSFLLVDELSMGLAPVIVSRLLAATREAADGGVGVLLVEQQVERGLAIADRGYLLNRGTIAFEGSAQVLREHMHVIKQSYLGSPPRNVNSER